MKQPVDGEKPSTVFVSFGRGCPKTTDFDYISDTKCTPDIDIIDTKCNDSNGDSKSSDNEIITKCCWDHSTDVVPSRNSNSDSNGRNLCDLSGQAKNV